MIQKGELQSVCVGVQAHTAKCEPSGNLAVLSRLGRANMNSVLLCACLCMHVCACVCLAVFHFIVRVLLTLAYSRFHPSGFSSLSSPSFSPRPLTHTPPKSPPWAVSFFTLCDDEPERYSGSKEKGASISIIHLTSSTQGCD